MTCTSIAEHSSKEEDYRSTSYNSELKEKENLINKLIKEKERLEKKESYTNYTIEDIVRIDSHIVLKIKYLDSTCDYEGQKLLVYLNITEAQLIKWKKIDPHFKQNTSKLLPSEAPSPVARFLANKEGMEDAINYLKLKSNKVQKEKPTSNINYPNSACASH